MTEKQGLLQGVAGAGLVLALAVFIGFDGSVDKVATSVHVAWSTARTVLSSVQDVFLLKFPHGIPSIVLAQSIAAATKVRAIQDKEGRDYYWLHALILTVLTGFGGGIIAPILIGRPPLIFQNELILTCCIASWYVVNTLPGAQRVLTSLPMRTVLALFIGLFRTHTVCNIVKAANESLPASSAFYPHAFWGPIISGTFLGSGGLFLPFDKGLGAVVGNGTPWPMQAALMTAVFYHLEVFDKTGFVGVGFRSVFGTHDDATVRTVVAAVQVASLLAQALFDESANFFTPVHKLLYLVFQTKGPTNQDQTRNKTVGWDYHTRIRLEHVIEVLRAVIVTAVIVIHIWLYFPSAALVPGVKLPVGKHIGTCQLFSPLPCQPATLSLYPGLRLAAYKGRASTDAAKAGASTWAVDIPARLAAGESAHAALGIDGVLRVVATSPGGAERQLWASKGGKCKAGAAVQLSLNANAIPTISCGADSFPLA